MVVSTETAFSKCLKKRNIIGRHQNGNAAHNTQNVRSNRKYLFFVPRVLPPDLFRVEESTLWCQWKLLSLNG